jgi:phosphoribosylglycinamide formyltransferase-1
MKKFAVFASGRGSNLGAIITAIGNKQISAELALVFSDRRDALALKRAHDHNIPAVLLEREAFPDKRSFEEAIIVQLKKYQIDFIVLAGYMRILSPQFIESYRNKILNIHPSYLPAFKGAHAIQDAFDARVADTGVTVHLVDEEIDHGTILVQEKVQLLPQDTLDSLEERIHQVEHRIYPKAIDLFARKIK